MKLTDHFLEPYKTRRVQWGYGELGHIVFLRTYARAHPEGGVESWWQTIRRVVEGVYAAQKEHCDKNGLPWNAMKAQISAQRMYDLIYTFKFLPPGRGLWAMGTDYVKKRGSAALNNCAFISTENLKQDFTYPFCFLMDMSMLGVGVGSDTRGADIVTIKQPAPGEVFVVEDSREGWVESVRVALGAFGEGGPMFAFDYSKVRPAGSLVKGFGGVSAGPGPLRDLHNAIHAMFMHRIGETFTSTDIVDIFNLIGKAVVSGGIRRTAEIMLGSPDDAAFLTMKDPRHADALRSHRWASNNSIIAPVGSEYSRHIGQIMQNGEPGFFFLENARSYRRMKDKKGTWDQFVMGQNPCGEISLESGELCNLVEVYPNAHETFEEFKITLKWAYLYAKSVSLIPTHNLQTNAIIGRNRRLGVSLSGIVQAMERHGARKLLHWMDEGYKELRQMDTIYSKWLCVPESIKLTTVKPSGTVSLLTGATPGIHFPHAEYYMRNVRFDPSSPLLNPLQEAGYKVEKSVADDGTFVVSFPVHEKFFQKSKRQASMWEQLELAAQLQHYWADNSVSVTVTVKPEEVNDLPRALSLYESRLKSVSFLPLENHGYVQAPYEEITQNEYLVQAAFIKPLDEYTLKGVTPHDTDERGCESDRCIVPSAI